MRFRPSLLLVALLLVAAVTAAISPARAAVPDFPDVPSYHPYALAIQDLASRQIINGFADGSFQPDRPVTRQQFAKMILLSLGVPVSEDDWPSQQVPFVDLGADDPGSLYPHEYVAKAALLHITNGKDATHFAPGDNISRAQVVTMVVRAAQSLCPEAVSLSAGPTDSPWGAFDPTHAANAALAQANGLLAALGADSAHPTGNPAALDPFGRMSRGEVAQVLHNLLERIAQTGTTSSSTTTTTQELGDLMHFYWTAADGWKAENVSTLTGMKVAGPPAYVRTLPGMTADGLIAKYRDKDLALVSNTNLPAWLGMIGTPLADQSIAGPLTSWLTTNHDQTRVLTHVAGPSLSGDLLHFWYGFDGSVQLPIMFENVGTLTGSEKIEGQVANYTTFWGDAYEAEHVAARSVNGNLLVFWDVAPLHNWKVVNVSSITGRKIAGSPVAWTRILAGGLAEDHMAAVGPDGHLLHFYWTAAADWKVEDLTTKLGGPSMAGPLVQWSLYNTPIPGGDRLAGVDSNGHLMCFWRSPGSPTWSMEDLSAKTGRTVHGPLAAYWNFTQTNPPMPPDFSWEHVIAQGDDGHLLIFWDELSARVWQVVDVTAITGVTMGGPYAAWVSSVAGAPETTHIAGVKR